MTELEKLIEEGTSLQKKYKDNFAINLTVDQNKYRYAFLEKELAKSFPRDGAIQTIAMPNAPQSR